ncbi:hypothetical protein LHYA1_G003332 [Lachnellula hyalina]|uniref:Uncharacterized protein n=1 Tax=Lachnellula hyalina TaxID=1316788 RepID=A0A8H8R4J6_9HELO|nr:uncharacterized protein LHYA1_G003332 [Lachnellula hyalina]TVY28223.1 hypothetical protein LHYA1_G003332 [Lachnellula hyalina]
MATFRHTTPPPTSRIHTPSTPLFGTFDDDYQPYSPRKSSRISQRSRAAQTPPPQSASRNLRTNPSSSGSSSTSPYLTSQPRSPQTAPKKRGPKSDPEISGRRVSGALNYESTVSAAAALGLPTPTPRKAEKMRPVDVLRANGMLPTPAKTPQKRPEEGQTPPEVTAIARNLFSVRPDTLDEVMPSPKRKGKKRYTGFTLDSFEAENDQTPIAIYTDSNERIPEADMSMDNPFYGEGAEHEYAEHEPSKRSMKRRKIMVPGEGEQDLEDVEQRKDGVICVFRGRKVFRKFSDAQSLDHRDTGSMADGSFGEAPAAEASASGASRLLFPSDRQLRSKDLRSQAVEDEEADTDIDESSMLSTPRTRPGRKTRSITNKSTPQYSEEISTPMAPRFAPAVPISPPSTSRATRSRKIDMSSSPAGPDSDDALSPFDSWSRVKNPKKRVADTPPSKPSSHSDKRLKF